MSKCSLCSRNANEYDKITSNKVADGLCPRCRYFCNNSTSLKSKYSLAAALLAYDGEVFMVRDVFKIRTKLEEIIYGKDD